MNIAAIQAMVGQNLQGSSNGVQTGQAASGTFGSVFSSIAATGTTAIAPIQQQLGSQISDESILAIFNATSIEELMATLQEVIGEDAESSVSIPSLGDVEELAESLNLEPKQLMESLLVMLEQAGLNEGELSTLANTNDFWVVLNAIDQVAPQFFKGLTDALEGQGDLPKQQAVELLTLLKSVELMAPKTDLLMKQEQQVFTLQSYLATSGERFESVLNSNGSAKNSMVQLMEVTRQAIRFVAPTETKQPMTDEGTTNKSPETSQQAVSSAVGTVAVAKGEFTVTELENRNNAKNEALVREMQNIFKRSNFGQTGGTNRLLIKMYPEHLGQIRIELLQTNGVMTARILASTALGKEMLDSQLNQLRQAFVQQNVQVDRIDVSQTLQDTARNDREQAFNEHLKKENQEAENQQEQNDEEELTFQEYMIELEV